MGAAKGCQLIHSEDVLEAQTLQGGFGTSSEVFTSDQRRFCAIFRLILILAQLHNLLASMAWIPSLCRPLDAKRTKFEIVSSLTSTHNRPKHRLYPPSMHSANCFLQNNLLRFYRVIFCDVAVVVHRFCSIHRKMVCYEQPSLLDMVIDYDVFNSKPRPTTPLFGMAQICHHR